MKLYDVADSAETRGLIDGILSVRARPGTARVPSAAGAPPWASAMCRGVDIEVELEPSRFSGNGMLMMGNVLDVFFGLYCSINSFTRLTVRARGQSGILKRWPPRAGAQQLL
jgi:type VI secretion system protein ImpG